MQISSIVDIVGGKLLNTPAISFITQIHTNPSKINDGDLFIVTNKNDIQLAIQNGAFALLFDFDIEISDDEIAWIKVEDISSAMMKLLRFILSNKNMKSFYCDDITFEFFNIYSYMDKNLILLLNDIKIDFEILKDTTNQNILICTNKKYIKDIQPLVQDFHINKRQIGNLIQHSLFNTTFSYQDKFYSKLKMPSMYINHFLSISEFFNTSIDINRLKLFKYFSPIFINKHFEMVDFGKSNKFILTSDNQNLIEDEINFLNTCYSYGKIVIINKFTSDTDLFMQIKSSNYNALYINGLSKESLITLLENNKKDLTTLI